MINQKNFFKELEEIVSIESPSTSIEGTTNVAKYLERKLLEIGWFVEWIDVGNEVGPCLKATNKKSEKYDLLMLGHMDTVFPLGTIDRFPFTIDGNIIKGPGVIDMKAGLLYMYHIAKVLTEKELLNNTSLCLLFNSDEEIGSKKSRATIEAEALKAKLVFVLEGARVNGAMVKERKGVGRYTIDFKGIASHAGVAPQNGASAIVEMANWIIALNELNDFSKGTTINSGVVKGGISENVVADHAQVKIDLRVTDINEAKKVENKIQELLKVPFNPKVKVSVEGGLTRPPMNATAETITLCNKVSEIAKLMNIENLDWVSTGGGSDANFTVAMGVPTLDGLGPIGGEVHSEREYLFAESCAIRFNLLLEVIKQIVIK